MAGDDASGDSPVDFHDEKKPTDLQAALRRLEDSKHQSAQEQRPQSERRFKRFAVRCEARLQPGKADHASHSTVMTVQVRDVSRGGVGLLAGEQVSPGHFWQLELIDSGVTIATIPSFCRHCQPVADRAYLIGVEFGVQASVMLALGVTAKELAAGDEYQVYDPVAGDFVGSESLLENDAA